MGNSQFAAYFETLFAEREAYRIVNDRDIVARLPRSGTVAGAVLDYEHVGKTVLVAETAKEADSFAGFWVEGSSDEAACPLLILTPNPNPNPKPQTPTPTLTLTLTLTRCGAAARACVVGCAPTCRASV